MLIASDYNNMSNMKKTVIHIPKFRVGQHLLLFEFHWFADNSWYKKELCFGKKTKC